MCGSVCCCLSDGTGDAFNEVRQDGWLGIAELLYKMADHQKQPRLAPRRQRHQDTIGRSAGLPHPVPPPGYLVTRPLERNASGLLRMKGGIKSGRKIGAIHLRTLCFTSPFLYLQRSLEWLELYQKIYRSTHSIRCFSNGICRVNAVWPLHMCMVSTWRRQQGGADTTAGIFSAIYLIPLEVLDPEKTHGKSSFVSLEVLGCEHLHLRHPEPTLAV